MFKTTDSGQTWNAAGLADSLILRLAIDPTATSTVYATTRGGLFKSSDAGKSWSSMSNGLPAIDITAIAVDPMTPSTLYAGAVEFGVYKSMDGGGTLDVLERRVDSTNISAFRST